MAAYGVLMYINMIFLAAFIGYSIGTAPVISFHYGAGNHGELKNLLRRVFLLPLIWGIDGIWVSIVVAEAMAVAVTLLFQALNRRKYQY